MADLSREAEGRMEKARDVWLRDFGPAISVSERAFLRRAYTAGFAAAHVEAEERHARLRDALEDAESFIEQVETWSGSDPDEVHEALADIRAVLAVSSTENEEKQK